MARMMVKEWHLKALRASAWAALVAGVSVGLVLVKNSPYQAPGEVTKDLDGVMVWQGIGAGFGGFVLWLLLTVVAGIAERSDPAPKGS